MPSREGRFSISLIAVAVALVAGLGVIVIKAPLARVIITAGTTALTAFSFWVFHGEMRDNRLPEKGQATEVTILEVSETGITVQNNHPPAKLRLLVEPADGKPYEVNTKCLMIRLEISA